MWFDGLILQVDDDDDGGGDKYILLYHFYEIFRNTVIMCKPTFWNKR
jgi:hypothetical protein